MKLQEAITTWDDLERIWALDDDEILADPIEIVLPEEGEQCTK